MEITTIRRTGYQPNLVAAATTKGHNITVQINSTDGLAIELIVVIQQVKRRRAAVACGIKSDLNF